MNKTIISRVPHQPDHRLQPPSNASSLSSLKARQCAKIAAFRDALITSGFDSLDDQAAVLGLSRSSTWTILNRDYKASGLSSSIVNRIMNSPRLPRAARDKLEEYVREKLRGNYGHSPNSLRRFRDRLLSFPDAATSQLERRAGDQSVVMDRRASNS